MTSLWLKTGVPLTVPIGRMLLSLADQRRSSMDAKPNRNSERLPRAPWNKGKMIGSKPDKARLVDKNQTPNRGTLAGSSYV